MPDALAPPAYRISAFAIFGLRFGLSKRRVRPPCTPPCSLDRKLWRDLRRIKGQAIAVALVMACGLAMMIMARSLIYSLDSTRQEYYEANRFAEVFALLKRAPNSLAARIAEIPGVAAGPVRHLRAGHPGHPQLDEPASGMVRSLPDIGPPELNRLFLRSGRWLSAEARREVLVGEAFAEANHLQPGDTIAMLLNGKRQSLRIAGIVLSPGFIFISRPGTALPDDRTYGVFLDALQGIGHGLRPGRRLQFPLAHPGSRRPPNARSSPRWTGSSPLTAGGAPMAGEDHPSHIRLSDEIRILNILSIAFPSSSLSVAAFMTNAVLLRLLALQREQIAILKAFGFTNREIVLHYLKFAFVIVAVGTVSAGIGGLAAGTSADRHFTMSFPVSRLVFRPDAQRLSAGAGGCAAGGDTRGVQRGAPGGPSPASGGHAPRTAGQLQARAGRAHRHRPSPVPHFPHRRAQPRTAAHPGHFHRRRPGAGHGHSDCPNTLSATGSPKSWIFSGTSCSGRT